MFRTRLERVVAVDRVRSAVRHQFARLEQTASCLVSLPPHVQFVPRSSPAEPSTAPEELSVSILNARDPETGSCDPPELRLVCGIGVVDWPAGEREQRAGMFHHRINKETPDGAFPRAIARAQHSKAQLGSSTVAFTVFDA